MKAVRHPEGRVGVFRGGLPESVHLFSAAVMSPEGRLLASWGDPSLPFFLRSLAKPFQVLPLLREARRRGEDLSPEEVAVASASHAGEEEHLRAVRLLLRRGEIGEEEVACGMSDNCSGKHAAFLLLARWRGWSRGGYLHPSHPVQEEARAEVARMTGLDPGFLPLAPDGCGAPTFFVPLSNVALAYARLGGWEECGEVRRAVISRPRLVAGEGRFATALMEAAGGGVLAKDGAEGSMALVLPEEGIGLAVKVRDGASRAVPPAVLGVLGALGFHWAGLEEWTRRPLTDRRGRPVGEMRVM